MFTEWRKKQHHITIWQTNHTLLFKTFKQQKLFQMSNIIDRIRVQPADKHITITHEQPTQLHSIN